MNKAFVSIILSLFLTASGFSQQLLGTCGSSLEDNLLIKQRMLENRAEWQGKLIQRGGAPSYVPVRYWLVARADGTGRLPFKNVIDNLCALNKIYASLNMVFYLKETVNWDNQFVFDDPTSTLGQAYINQKMQTNKNAINIFTANVANASDLGVLAFYRPQGDYVVSNKLYVSSNGTTLAHELGHYFSLAHTFVGWENDKYDELTMSCSKPTPILIGGGFLVEYVDRNKPGTNPSKKNCQEAADGFCDTPADYNLGLGFQGPGCVYTGCAKDPDNVKLDPDELNLMSYFLNCIKQFSTEQGDAIVKDYVSSGRNYLRNPVYIPKPEITDQVNYNYPNANTAPLGYDTVYFDWDDVPNADRYIFEIAENTGFNINAKVFVLNHSDTVLTNLKKSKSHYWRVTPFNQNSFCVVPKAVAFVTPSWTVASDNLEIEGVRSFVTQINEEHPNLIIQSNQSQIISLQIIDANGKIVEFKKLSIVNGENNIPLPKLNPGFHLYRILDKMQRSNSGKFIIQ